MRVAVIGAGGVGGWLAARLAVSGADVHLLARGAHLAAVRECGLTLSTPAGEVTARPAATDRSADVGPCDAVLFCVKAYDTAAAAAEHLPALCAGHTVVVSLQNGVDNADRLADVVGASRVAAGLALISAHIAGPGVVAHTGGPASVAIGDLLPTTAEGSAALVGALAAAGVDVRHTDRIREELWDKFAFLCALAGTTATTRLPIGEVRDCPESWVMFRRLVEEVYAVAGASGVAAAADAVDRRVAFAATLEPHVRASLHHDLAGGRRLELDALHGTVVRLGRELGVPTPTSEVVDAVLRPHAERARRRTDPARAVAAPTRGAPRPGSPGT